MNKCPKRVSYQENEAAYVANYKILAAPVKYRDEEPTSHRVSKIALSFAHLTVQLSVRYHPARPRGRARSIFGLLALSPFSLCSVVPPALRNAGGVLKACRPPHHRPALCTSEERHSAFGTLVNSTQSYESGRRKRRAFIDDDCVPSR